MVDSKTKTYCKATQNSTLRSPCFNFENSQHNQNLLSFTSQKYQSCLSPTSSYFDFGCDDTGEVEESEDRVDKEKVSMDQCIKSLEPHLQAFRKNCNGLENDDDINAIPSPLLRVVKFFAFKWKPIQRAILRPASYSKDEVCP